MCIELLQACGFAVPPGGVSDMISMFSAPVLQGLLDSLHKNIEKVNTVRDCADAIVITEFVPNLHKFLVTWVPVEYQPSEEALLRLAETYKPSVLEVAQILCEEREITRCLRRLVILCKEMRQRKTLQTTEDGHQPQEI